MMLCFYSCIFQFGFYFDWSVAFFQHVVRDQLISLNNIIFLWLRLVKLNSCLHFGLLWRFFQNLCFFIEDGSRFKRALRFRYVGITLNLILRRFTRMLTFKHTIHFPDMKWYFLITFYSPLFDIIMNFHISFDSFPSHKWKYSLLRFPWLEFMLAFGGLNLRILLIIFYWCVHKWQKVL